MPTIKWLNLPGIRAVSYTHLDVYKRQHLNIGGGVNVFAVFSVMASVALVFCGLWIPGLHMLYDASWFIGTGLSIVLYYALMKKADPVYLENKKVEHMEQLNKKNT